MLTSNDILAELHYIIDEKFKRTDRSKMVNPILLKNQLTLWFISQHFINENPEVIAILLKELVKEGRVVTNLDEVSPIDAYFIPKTELIDEESFKIYSNINKKLLK